MPLHVTWQDLKTEFAQVGPVVHVDVPHTPSGVSKGYAIIEFERAVDARRAAEDYKDALMDGQRMEVRLDRKA